MRQALTVTLFALGLFIGYVCGERDGVAAQQLTRLDGDLVANDLRMDLNGKLLIACLADIHTEPDLIAALRRIPRGLVQLVGYVDDRGDAQMLNRSMLYPKPRPDIIPR